VSYKANNTALVIDRVAKKISEVYVRKLAYLINFEVVAL